MPEGSQVTKVTLLVQIGTDGRGRPRAFIELNLKRSKKIPSTNFQKNEGKNFRKISLHISQITWASRSKSHSKLALTYSPLVGIHT